MSLVPTTQKWAENEPFYAPISISTTGDNTVISGTAGLRIRIVKYSLVCAGAVVVTFKSSIAGAISGPMSFAANGGISEPAASCGLMQTAVGEDLVINLNGNVSTGGMITYILV